MSLYVLDTNTVSYFARGHSAVTHRLSKLPLTSVRISAVTEGELRFGVVRRPANKQLQRSIEEFLLRVDIMPWDSNAAQRYALLRTACERVGKGVGALDLLIAAHAVSIGGILVTSDKALLGMRDLAVEDWTVPV